ncbi:MAG TPA: 50S ribosomal protein L25 [Symbiobacteriaceae bacterium]|nr:50S ribosomal protein L25 [Symbiobacteriaceae bacterium]
MKAQLVMQLEPREKGHSAVLKAKQNGKVPGVLYGFDGSSTPVAVPLALLRGAIAQGGEHHPFMAEFDGKSVPVVIRGIQRDLYTNLPTHFDLMPVAPDHKLTVTLPIRFHGEKELNSRGLHMHVELHEVTLHGRASDLPEGITLAVGQLKPGATIAVGDLALPPGVTVHEKPGVAIVHVAHSRVHQEETTV